MKEDLYIHRIVPEYYDMMYLDGYTPTEILHAAHKKMLNDFKRRNERYQNLKIKSEIKIK